VVVVVVPMKECCVEKRNKEYDEAELSQTPNRTALWWSNVALAACWLK
jgi:hypothetical protein